MTYTVYEAMPLSQMLARVQKYYPGDGYKLVEKAYLFAQEAHKNQYRKSGEPYFTHPCFVASILVELSLDPPTIAAGLLHDTVEDCEGITLDTIRQEFGEEVAMLVDGVTKLNKLDFADKEEAQAESLRKMILAMGKDIRVVLIKLADRLHNMRTLKFQKEERRVAIARETLDIYAPIAHRLGVYAHQAGTGGLVPALHRPGWVREPGAEGRAEALGAGRKYPHGHRRVVRQAG